MTEERQTTGTRIRLDKWLWAARFARSRSGAQILCASGLIRLSGARVEKPGRELRVGDTLTLPRGRDILVIRVLAAAERRQSAREATRLYEIVTE